MRNSRSSKGGHGCLGTAAGPKQYLTFLLGREMLAFEARSDREVLAASETAAAQTV